MSRFPPAPESLWPARLALVSVIGLNLSLNEALTAGPTWLLPALETVLLLPLSVLRSRERHHVIHRRQRPELAQPVRLLALGLIAVLYLTNLVSLGLLITGLLNGSGPAAAGLLAGALNIWVTNVLVFSLWYWELDQGGPLRRGQPGTMLDFAFPQTTLPQLAPSGWRPEYLDYLFVAFTNAAAFSPTDTLPLSRRVKGLMTVQAATSMLTVVLVASRAVNILK
ncbi:DUF1345 domain-containing protein [Deinococcus aquatilis]|uniref:DUF1345 domain-containing protein n=1 Tax=Deinococcus aquatilis TaxID=519440 RepID=UPI000370381F|nr:DUF1345 domain-containing protein [Deinococcus aquatilis]